MPRRARLNLPEVPLHIVQHGNNRQPTFFADDDCVFYLEYLKDAPGRCEFACEVGHENSSPESVDSIHIGVPAGVSQYKNDSDPIFRRLHAERWKWESDTISYAINQA